MAVACDKCGQENIQDLWVSDEGTYGWNQLVLVDTTGWTQGDYDKLEECSDWDRMQEAIDIAEKRGGSYRYA